MVHLLCTKLSKIKFTGFFIIHKMEAVDFDSFKV